MTRDKDRWRARYAGPDGRESSKTFSRRIDAEGFLATIEVNIIRGEWIDPAGGKKTLAQ